MGAKAESKKTSEGSKGSTASHKQEPPANDRASKAKSTRRKQAPRGSRQVRLESIPTAEVWYGGRSVGTTPYDVPIESSAKRYILKARGYADTPYAVGPRHRSGSVLVSLLRPGYLTVRVTPPASEIWLDKKQVGSGILNRYATAPGQHRLVVRYYRDGKEVGVVGPRTVLVEPGKETRLAPINVPLDGSEN